MSTTERINELHKQIDAAISERNLLLVRLLSMELRELEEQEGRRMDLNVTRCFEASRNFTNVTLN